MQLHLFLCVEQVAACNFHTQTVVEECLGQAQVEVEKGSGERHVLHVALSSDVEVGLSCERGQNLDVVVKLNQEDRALGADGANGGGNPCPVLDHAQ